MDIKELGDFRTNINHVYSSSQLELIKNFIINYFVANAGKVSNDSKVAAVFKRKTFKSYEIQDLLVYLLTSKNDFLNFFKTLLPKSQKVLEYLVWQPYLTPVTEIEEKFGIKVFNGKGIYSYEIFSNVNPIFCLCEFSKTEYLYSSQNTSVLMPSFIRHVLCEYFEKPKDYYLIPQYVINSDLLIFNAEDVIFNELAKLNSYVSQNQLKLTNVGIPALPSARKASKLLKIKEFFPEDEDFSSVRTILISTFLGNQKKSIKTDLELMKEMYESLIKDFWTSLFIFDLKGLNDNMLEPRFFISKYIIEIIKNHDINSWISFENFYKIFCYKGYNYIIIDPYNIYRGYFNYNNRHYELNTPQRVYTFVEDHCRSIFFFMASMGWIEIAYSRKVPERLFPRPFFALQYFRLTNLGLYIIGKLKNYEVKKAEAKDIISLSDVNLDIMLLEEDEPTTNLLTTFSKKISPTRYRVTLSQFMTGIKSQSELKSKINLFKDLITSDLPNNWIEFFKELTKRCKDFEIVTNQYQVIKIPENIKNLFVEDEVLRNIVLKSERMMGLVHNNDFVIFKNRMKSLGYFV